VAQVPLAEDNDMIKTFPSDRANQPFRISVLHIHSAMAIVARLAGHEYLGSEIRRCWSAFRSCGNVPA
jgi:hypothetical protein